MYFLKYNLYESQKVNLKNKNDSREKKTKKIIFRLYLYNY